ncbi:hypothetical protein FRC09_010105 [Ceratobasidium sp. 395]|nr:hypothetical protein FRC09_010105 [Ceratobasidium sp. 395]
MANYSQLATDRFGLDIFAMTPAALPAPFGIEPLHDWSPAHYARSPINTRYATQGRPDCVVVRILAFYYSNT